MGPKQHLQAVALACECGVEEPAELSFGLHRTGQRSALWQFCPIFFPHFQITNLSSAGEIMQLLKRANRNRTSEPTAANQTSSRSHAVMTISVEQSERTANTSRKIEISKLSMIDLAGSERACSTSNRGIRMLEGANINRSLLALGNCITALANSDGRRGVFVPYRDSKLICGPVCINMYWYG